MEARSKWLWTITIANIAVTSLLIVVSFSIWLALAVIAPGISVEPLLILVPISLLLSFLGLVLAKTVVPRKSRWVSVVVNGCALAFDSLIILTLATILFRTTTERFLIPDGYEGDVYVVYGARDGQPLNKTRWRITYRIPPSGILLTQTPLIPRWTRTEYYYEKQNGSLEQIRNFWPTTIHKTLENLANDRDVGVFFPRTGKLTEGNACSVQFEQFYVGTKAYLLSQYREADLGRYVRGHPGACSN
jgi:hypothetical protein